MRYGYLLLLCLTFLCGRAARAQAPPTYPAFGGMSLLGRWQDPDSAVFYNDIWGYVAPDGREYAIVGSSYGTNFVDVTNPAQPRLVARIAGRRDHATWRDFKTYGHYAYGVADAGAHSLQIFDLSGLPNTVQLIADRSDLCQSAHTCFIEGKKLYLIAPEADWVSFRSDVAVLSLDNPEVPTKVSQLMVSEGAGHAAFARHDTLYLSAANGMFTYDMHDPLNPRLLGWLHDYPFAGYNHSSWSTTDGKLFVVADEVPSGLPLKLFDMRDVAHPRLLSTFNSHPLATPHNPYIVGNRYVVSSAYQDGVQVWDIQDPEKPQHLGGFDTRPENDSSATGYNGYVGCWGVYPFLPSGTIIASDIQRGLFVLRPPYPTPVQVAPPPPLPDATLPPPVPTPAPMFGLWPNPAREAVTLSLRYPSAELVVDILDVLGRPMRAEQRWAEPTGAVTVSLAGLTPGTYWLRVRRADDVTRFERVVVQ